MSNEIAVIIVSDLDGSLLDHNSYQFNAACPALKKIKQNNIPLILNSSKTATEMMIIREALKNNHPFVVENGAGIYLPTDSESYEIIKFGQEREEILSKLNQIKENLSVSYIGFDDMSVEELMSCTGLDKKQAESAKQRDFSEPLLWQDDDDKWTLFCQELNNNELAYAKGGRFISVSTDVDKGQSISWLRNYYKEQLNLTPIIVALGDSENDKQMLENAEFPVLIKSPAHEFPEVDVENLIMTTEYGPLGWNNSVIKILDSLI
jgi:mannosyl-3-phosphoglycerate phosphatase